MLKIVSAVVAGLFSLVLATAVVSAPVHAAPRGTASTAIAHIPVVRPACGSSSLASC
jgi:hypothetical protein